MKRCSVLVYVISMVSLCSCFSIYFVDSVVSVLCASGSRYV